MMSNITTIVWRLRSRCFKSMALMRQGSGRSQKADARARAGILRELAATPDGRTNQQLQKLMEPLANAEPSIHDP